jgi:hypothetical protein
MLTTMTTMMGVESQLMRRADLPVLVSRFMAWQDVGSAFNDVTFA